MNSFHRAYDNDDEGDSEYKNENDVEAEKDISNAILTLFSFEIVSSS